MNLKRFLPLTACFLLSATQLSAQTPPVETPAAKAPCNCNDLDAAQARLARMDSILKDWPNLARYREAVACRNLWIRRVPIDLSAAAGSEHGRIGDDLDERIRRSVDVQHAKLAFSA